MTSKKQPKEYTDEFRLQCVQTMLGGVSANALSASTGVSQPTLSRWLRAARAEHRPTSLAETLQRFTGFQPPASDEGGEIIVIRIPANKKGSVNLAALTKALA